jgi:tetratricopeptide (TPR) repeat protein
LAKQFPNDFRVQRSVWLTSSILCELYIDKGDGDKAIETCLPTIAFPTNALGKEPENGVVAFDLAISHFNSSRGYRLAGRYRETIVQAQKAIEVMSKLSAKTPDNMDYKRNLAVYETEIAHAKLKLGQFDESLAALEKVVQMLEPIAVADPATTTTRLDIGIAHRLAAEAHHKKGEKTKAIDAVDKAIRIATEMRELNALRDSDKHLVAELEKERSNYAQ